MNHDHGSLVLGGDHAIAEAMSSPLRDYDFTDLYISEAGAARIRGLKDENGPLIEVPEAAISDLDKLHKIVCTLGQSEDEFPIDFDEVRYRVSKIAGQDGVWYALRRLMWPIPRLATFGIERGIYRELGRLGKRPGRGLILVAGATGNGKTTTCCSLLQEYLIQFGDIAITIEDPPELRMEGKHGRFGQCFQIKVSDGDFAKPLRSALRYNPRFILLGEIRDPEAASEALRAAISGHIVLATIHGGSIPEALTSVLKLVSARLDLDLAKSMLGDGIAAVLHQELRLVTASDGRAERRPFVKSLFFDGDQGLRSKIREGKMELISTEIEQQSMRLARGEPAVAVRKPAGR